MSDLSTLTNKQLIDRHRFLADRVINLKEKIQPLFEEYEKIRTEYLDIDRELAKRQDLPTIETNDDKPG